MELNTLTAYRFGDSVALHVGGETVYIEATAARAFAQALCTCATSIERESFASSKIGTLRVTSVNPNSRQSKRYRVVRYYERHAKRTIATGLTLEQAQAHCSNPETSSTTATNAKARKRTATRGAWFDGYEESR